MTSLKEWLTNNVTLISVKKVDFEYPVTYNSTCDCSHLRKCQSLVGKILRNKQYHKTVLRASFYLNGHTPRVSSSIDEGNFV